MHVSTYSRTHFVETPETQKLDYEGSQECMTIDVCSAFPKLITRSAILMHRSRLMCVSGSPRLPYRAIPRCVQYNTCNQVTHRLNSVVAYLPAPVPTETDAENTPGGKCSRVINNKGRLCIRYNPDWMILPVI